MNRYFIHVRDRGRTFADTEGVEVANTTDIHPHIVQTVREIVRDEGRWAINDPRTIEVATESGRTIFNIPFRRIMLRQ